jgi:hypothetical protein
MGWTQEHYFKEADDEAFCHSLLMTLLEHYANLHATMHYCSIEHKHPPKGSHWKTEICVKALDEAKNANKAWSLYTPTL